MAGGEASLQILFWLASSPSYLTIQRDDGLMFHQGRVRLDVSNQNSGDALAWAAKGGVGVPIPAGTPECGDVALGTW